MQHKAGFEIVKVVEIPWEDRRNVDNWPSRAGMYCDDKPSNTFRGCRAPTAVTAVK